MIGPTGGECDDEDWLGEDEELTAVDDEDNDEPTRGTVELKPEELSVTRLLETCICLDRGD